MQNQQRNCRVRINIEHAKAVGKDGPPIDCTVLDLSDLGAQIVVSPEQKLPAQFTLILSPTGAPVRRCRLMWQRSGNAGVLFDADWRHRDQPAST